MEIDPVWRNISLALGAEPREHPTVRGASGIDHQFTALAVDEPGKRLILFSPDPDPRVAALTQIDVQATMPDTRVLLARPLAFDLSVIARNISKTLGSTKIDVPRALSFMQRMSERPDKVQKRVMQRAMSRVQAESIDPMALALRESALPVLGQLIGVIQQSAYLDWHSIFKMIGRDSPDNFVSLDGLLRHDTLIDDRRHVICPIPFYEFSNEEWEIVRSDVSETRSYLKRIGVYEYFFPSPDELALGLIENGLKTGEEVDKATQFAEKSGHIIGTPSIVDTKNPLQTIEALKEIGYLAEGEFGLETTSEGDNYRISVKFRPKESLFSKVLARISVKLNASLSDFTK